jgi:hypothetical protein
MAFWDEVATIGIEIAVAAVVIVGAAALPVVASGVASTFQSADWVALNKTAAAAASAAADSTTAVANFASKAGGLLVQSIVSVTVSNSKDQISNLIDNGVFTGDLISDESNQLIVNLANNSTANYGSMSGIYTMPLTYYNNYYVVHTSGSWKIETSFILNNHNINLLSLIEDYIDIFKSYGNTNVIEITHKHTINKNGNHVYKLTATLPIDYNKVSSQDKMNVEHNVAKMHNKYNISKGNIESSADNEKTERSADNEKTEPSADNEKIKSSVNKEKKNNKKSNNLKRLKFFP